jgi:enoyl-CoA hydratase/carnithine racemase
VTSIRTEKQGTTYVLTLDRPEKKNALTREMYRDLTRGLAEAGADDGVTAALVLGAPGAFSAGNDINDFLQDPPTGEDSEVFRFLDALVRFEKPLVAGVDGLAVGVGVTMLLHCDLVVASTRSRFRTPFTRLGLVPEAGSSLLMPALMGHQRAMEWLLLGDFMDAEAARAAGLLNRLVAPEEVTATALGLAAKLAESPLIALIESKRLVRAATRTALREVMAKEGAKFTERLTAPETIAAFMAFGAKK